MSSCEKTFMHGHFLEPCSGKHDSKCGYVCDNGYIQQPIVQHVICNDGKWAVDRNSLCIGRYTYLQWNKIDKGNRIFRLKTHTVEMQCCYFSVNFIRDFYDKKYEKSFKHKIVCA